MPNHWHLLLWPRADGDLSTFVKWLATTHAVRWNRAHGLTGHGAVYQSRFKSVPVEDEVHFLRLLRYIERNARRAHLVEQAEKWKWGSAWCRQKHPGRLDEGPIPLPHNWETLINEGEDPSQVTDKFCQGV